LCEVLILDNSPVAIYQLSHIFPRQGLSIIVVWVHWCQLVVLPIGEVASVEPHVVEVDSILCLLHDILKLEEAILFVLVDLGTGHLGSQGVVNFTISNLDKIENRSSKVRVLPNDLLNWFRRFLEIVLAVINLRLKKCDNLRHICINQLNWIISYKISYNCCDYGQEKEGPKNSNEQVAEQSLHLLVVVLVSVDWLLFN
jgi:hypothetical protein